MIIPAITSMIEMIRPLTANPLPVYFPSLHSFNAMLENTNPIMPQRIAAKTMPTRERTKPTIPFVEHLLTGTSSGIGFSVVSMFVTLALHWGQVSAFS